MLGGVLSVFRNTVFLVTMLAVLFTTTLGATAWAWRTTAHAAALTGQVASMAAQHRKQVREAVFRAKAQARLRRIVVALPVAGAAAIGYFEEQDYQEWLSKNPEGTRGEYACQVSKVSGEVVGEMLQDLPEWMRPEPDVIVKRLPKSEEGVLE